MDASSGRTLLEAIIRDRRQTFEEFSEDAEQFAREHDESGTLSARHVQRLASGARADGRPLGTVRPATRRLLEKMLGYSIEDLLGPPGRAKRADDGDELAAALDAARTADPETVAAFQQRLDLARLLDRRLGGAHLPAELSEQIRQMQKLCHYSADAKTRQSLASIIADACTLVGWQWLDRSQQGQSWDYYAQGLTAAAESESAALRSYVLAGQSVVLLDLNEPAAALKMTEYARESAKGHTPPLLSAWLSAAHGEACAANNLHGPSLRAFDTAENLLSEASADEAPFLVFGQVHLARWRGNALTRLRDRQAVDVLTRALGSLPADFTRAESALRADLSEAYETSGEREAAEFHARHADRLAQQVGSLRHRRRIDRLRRRISLSPPAEEPASRQ